MKEKQDPPGIFYFWRGERPLHPNAPQLHGTGEIKLESAERGAGYFTTLSETQLEVNAKTFGVYLRADPEDLGILNGRDDRSEEHTSELQSLMRIPYAVFCLNIK